MAVGPPVLAMAWFALPLIYVQAIAIGLVLALIMFSASWANLSNEATFRASERLLREINEHGKDPNQ